MDILHLVGALGGGSFVVAVVHQVRIHMRDSADRKLGRYVFDQTRDTSVWIEVIEARKPYKRPASRPPRPKRPLPPSAQDRFRERSK